MRSLIPLMALGTTALLSIMSSVQGALTAGFCPDCMTFAEAMKPCGGTLTPAEVEINGNYDLNQNLAKCQCTAAMQDVLWVCGRCEKLNQHQINMPPPTAHRSKCMGWGISVADYEAPYTGTVVAGTQGNIGGTGNPVKPAPPVTGGGGTGGSGGNQPSQGGGTTPGASPLPGGTDNSTMVDNGGSSSGGGPNGTAVGISVGIIGIAVVCGMAAVVMIKRRRRRRHEPLELNPPPLSGYSNLDDQWEKSGPITSQHVAGGSDAPAASRMPVQGRPEPFAARPYAAEPPIAYTGPHDKSGYGYDGYDNQYDNQGYDPNYYGHGGGHYDQYAHAPPPHHDYGYDQHHPQQYPRNPKAPESVVSGGYV